MYPIVSGPVAMATFVCSNIVCILCESSAGCGIDSSVCRETVSATLDLTPAVFGPGKREDKKNETTHQERIFTNICRGASSCVHVSTHLYNLQ